MALWATVQTLKQESLSQITSLYSEEVFPIEVRNIFAETIEEAVCGHSRLQDEKSIGNFFNHLIDQIQRRSLDQNTGDLFYVRRRLESAANNLKEKYSKNPADFFKLLTTFLAKEQSLLDEENSENQTSKDELFVQIRNLKQEIFLIGTIRKNIDEDQECLNLHCENLRMIVTEHQKQMRISGDANNADVIRLEVMKGNTQGIIENLVVSISQRMNLVASKLHELINTVVQVQKEIDGRIVGWKTEQRRSRNGFPMNLGLSTLRRLCEEFIEILWTTRINVMEAQSVRSNFILRMKQDPNDNVQLQQLSTNLTIATNLIEEFLNKCLIVNRQPPQVLKLKNMLPMISVCLLVGLKLNIDMANPKATVEITDEDSVRNSKIINRGKLVNASAKFEYHKDTNEFSAFFKNMALKKIQHKKKSEKGDSVMEEKFCLCFECTMTVGDMQIKISTISETLVVISHGSQEPIAFAAMIWDSAFAEPNRLPFDVPPFVTWNQLITVINAQISSMTGRELTEDNIEYLKRKALPEQPQSDIITFNDFCKTKMPGRSFTFWDWLFKAIRAIQKFCKEPWIEGHVVGFIDKSKADALLANCNPGTFLLRFSDSSLGAISVVCAVSNGTCCHVKPYEYVELKSHGLADKIINLETTICVYPGVPKEIAFGKYVNPTINGNMNGTHSHQYVSPRTTLQLPIRPSLSIGGQHATRTQEMSPVSDRYDLFNDLNNIVPTPTHEMNNLTFDDDSMSTHETTNRSMMSDDFNLNHLMKLYLQSLDAIEPVDEPMEGMSY